MCKYYVHWREAAVRKDLEIVVYVIFNKKVCSAVTHQPAHTIWRIKTLQH